MHEFLTTNMYFSTYLLPPQHRLLVFVAELGSVALETLRLKICSAQTSYERRCGANLAELTASIHPMPQTLRSAHGGHIQYGVLVTPGSVIFGPNKNR